MRLKKFHPELIKEASLSSPLFPLRMHLDSNLGWNSLDPQIPLTDDTQAMLGAYLFMLKNDPIFITFLMAMTDYFACPERKIYNIGKDFFDVFKDTTLESVQFKHLPTECAGFVQLPYYVTDEDGDEFNCFYFTCIEPANTRWTKIDNAIWASKSRVVVIGYPTKVGSFGTVHAFATDLDEFLKEGFDKVGKNFRADLQGGITTSPCPYSKTHATLFNILVYLASGNPDLRSYRNNIKMRSAESSKIVRADRDLSLEDVQLVGFGYKKEPMRECAGWWSKDHMGWRHCGPGRQQLKWTFIKGSEKRWHTPEANTEEDSCPTV